MCVVYVMGSFFAVFLAAAFFQCVSGWRVIVSFCIYFDVGVW